MRAIAFGVLLAVFVAGYHGQQKHPQTDKVQKAGEQSPPKAASPVANPASEKQKQSTYQKTKAYLGKAFGPEYLAAWVLVIIGVGGVCAALRTLGTIKRQTGVLTESQRPRIIAEAAQSPSETFGDRDAPRVVLRVTNRGSTPATYYTYESWIEVLSDTVGNFTSAADYFKFGTKSVLYPNSSQSINIPLRNGVNDQDRFEVSKLRKYVCVRLRVEYQDPFIARRRCHADFGFYIIPNGFGFLSKHNGMGYEDRKET